MGEGEQLYRDRWKQNLGGEHAAVCIGADILQCPHEKTTLQTGAVALASRSAVSGSLWPHGLQQAGFPVLRCLPGFAPAPVHSVDDAIKPPRPLSSPSPSALSLSQPQDLFPWAGSSYQVAKLVKLQHQCLQWIWTAPSCVQLLRSREL